MSLFVAVILLGQVGDNSQVDAQNNVSESPAVQVVDQPESPAASLRAPAPFRPTVETSPPARPSTRASIGDAKKAETPQPQFRRQPAEITEPPVVAASAATIATPAIAAATAPTNTQSLQVGATMIADILVLDEQAQQNLRRVRLIDALARIGDAGLQSTAIRAYWDLTQAIAAVRFSADKVRVLSEVTPPAAEADQVLLAEALADAEAEEVAAQDTLLAAQFTLLRVTGMPLQDALPWPADAPLVAPYRTQFTTIFANQPAPLSLRQIHQSLPGKLSLIEKRVAAMSAAESATETLLDAYKRGGLTLSQLLASIERLDRSRRAFVNAIVDYNYQIAEYSLAVVGTGVGSETLVATLIKVPTANSIMVDVPRDIRQAGGTVRDGTPLR